MGGDQHHVALRRGGFGDFGSAVFGGKDGDRIQRRVRRLRDRQRGGGFAIMRGGDHVVGCAADQHRIADGSEIGGIVHGETFFGAEHDLPDVRIGQPDGVRAGRRRDEPIDPFRDACGNTGRDVVVAHGGQGRRDRDRRIGHPEGAGKRIGDSVLTRLDGAGNGRAIRRRHRDGNNPKAEAAGILDPYLIGEDGLQDVCPAPVPVDPPPRIAVLVLNERDGMRRQRYLLNDDVGRRHGERPCVAVTGERAVRHLEFDGPRRGKRQCDRLVRASVERAAVREPLLVCGDAARRVGCLRSSKTDRHAVARRDRVRELAALVRRPGAVSGELLFGIRVVDVLHKQGAVPAVSHGARSDAIVKAVDKDGARAFVAPAPDRRGARQLGRPPGKHAAAERGRGTAAVPQHAAAAGAARRHRRGDEAVLDEVRAGGEADEPRAVHVSPHPSGYDKAGDRRIGDHGERRNVVALAVNLHDQRLPSPVERAAERMRDGADRGRDADAVGQLEVPAHAGEAGGDSVGQLVPVGLRGDQPGRSRGSIAARAEEPRHLHATERAVRMAGLRGHAAVVRAGPDAHLIPRAACCAAAACHRNAVRRDLQAVRNIQRDVRPDGDGWRIRAALDAERAVAADCEGRSRRTGLDAGTGAAGGADDVRAPQGERGIAQAGDAGPSPGHPGEIDVAQRHRGVGGDDDVRVRAARAGERLPVEQQHVFALVREREYDGRPGGDVGPVAGGALRDGD